jgi:predicted DNA-binding protein
MDKRPDHITFRVSPASKAKLQALAKAERRPLSNLVALIVDKYLEELENKEIKR